MRCLYSGCWRRVHWCWRCGRRFAVCSATAGRPQETLLACLPGVGMPGRAEPQAWVLFSTCPHYSFTRGVGFYSWHSNGQIFAMWGCPVPYWDMSASWMKAVPCPARVTPERCKLRWESGNAVIAGFVIVWWKKTSHKSPRPGCTGTTHNAHSSLHQNKAQCVTSVYFFCTHLGMIM